MCSQAVGSYGFTVFAKIVMLLAVRRKEVVDLANTT